MAAPFLAALFLAVSARMRLELLGRGRVVADDGAVLLRAGLPLTLLAHLRLAGAPMLRGHLATLFWPGRDRPLALQSLRQALTRLRGALGDDVVLSHGRHLLVPASALDCDVEEVAEAVRQGDADLAAALWKGSVLEEARFPGNWELEDWLERERSRVGGMLRSAVLSGARTHAAGPSPPRALPLLAVLARHLPHDDEVLELRFEVLLDAGRGDEAAGVLEELRLLEGEDRVEPLRARLARAREPGRATRADEPVPAPAQADEPPAAASIRPPPVPPLSPSRPQRSGLRRAAAIIGFALVPLALFGTMLTLEGWAPNPEDAGGARGDARGGDTVVFCTAAATPGDALQTFRMSLEGRDKHRLTTAIGCMAAWVEALGALVIVDESGPVSRLVRLDPDPSNPQAEWRRTALPYTHHLGDLQLPRPQAGTTDGTRVLVQAAEAGGTRSLYWVDLAAGAVERLTDDAGDEQHPAWDPHRGQVLFSSDRGGVRSLWALDADDPGAGPRRLTDHALQDTRPTPHPRGILFVRGFGEGAHDGDMGLVLLEWDPATPTPPRETALVDEPWNDLDPAWSPRGTHLCWQSEEFGHYESQVKVMELSTRERWSVTSGMPGRHANCSFTAAGRHVVFMGMAESGVSQVFVVAREGGAPENLSRMEAAAAPLLLVPR
jgi:DNA-binding SARP family transcriptional activator